MSPMRVELDPTIHTEACRLLQEARIVVRMQKAEREKYYKDAVAARGQAAVRDLVTVVNTVRRATTTRSGNVE